ncbi:NEP1-interacting protein 1-like [Hibiscus syriacus]|uniref:NEP1-interacting protein 1-like n=1 Tax=Hibiscus syriacus TaxID=106335 RepID=UPI0019239D54|nr:NEP1-interacting protein 1-like [Hibiscus syriacus]
MTGALIGQEIESGFVRGAAVGAISGAVFSIEVFESSLVLWQSDESRIGCLLYLIDVIAILISGRLVRERIGPAMLSAVQSQMGAAETTFEDFQNIFNIGGTKGLDGDLVEKIPKIKIKNNNNADGEKVSCSVSLQVSISDTLLTNEILVKDRRERFVASERDRPPRHLRNQSDVHLEFELCSDDLGRFLERITWFFFILQAYTAKIPKEASS